MFCVSGEAEVFALMGNYAPFAVQETEALFSLNVEGGEVPRCIRHPIIRYAV